MAKLLQFGEGANVILVDVSPPGQGIHAAGVVDDVIEHAEEGFDKALSMAGLVAKSFSRVIDATGLAEAELELGFQFTGKGSIYLVQSEAQAALKVKVVFRNSSESASVK